MERLGNAAYVKVVAGHAYPQRISENALQGLIKAYDPKNGSGERPAVPSRRIRIQPVVCTRASAKQQL